MKELLPPPEFPVRTHRVNSTTSVMITPRLLPHEGYNITEISELTIQDWRIRSAMELALKMSEVEVQASTKLIDELGCVDLLSDYLKDRESPEFQYPIVLQPIRRGEDPVDKQLRDFAFDACDALADKFDESIWHDWYIAPYFLEGDDTRQTFKLGVFVVQSDQMM